MTTSDITDPSQLSLAELRELRQQLQAEDDVVSSTGVEIAAEGTTWMEVDVDGTTGWVDAAGLHPPE